MHTDGGGEAGTSQSQSRHKKGHMMNIYLTDSDDKAIVDFVKDYEELYFKTNEHFKDKARKECLWERSANSCKQQVCKTWFESQRTHYGKITQSKSGQAPTQMTERQNWIQDTYNFLKMHIRCKGLPNLQRSSPWPKELVHLLPQHTTSSEVQLTWIVWRSACAQTPQYSLQLQAPAQFPSVQQSPS